MSDLKNEPISSPNATRNSAIVITFALPDESRDIVARLKNARPLKKGALPVISGELAGKPVVIFHTGVGPDSCRTRITAFLDENRPPCLVTSGFAGGLDPAIKLGNVVIAENFSDPALLAKVAIKEAVPCTLTTQPVVAETVADKAALAARTQASAVDMETAIIAGISAAHGIPVLSIRGISDPASDDLPISFSIWFDTGSQKPRVGSLLLHLASHPWKIPPFVRFVRGISFARARLSDALVAVVEKL